MSPPRTLMLGHGWFPDRLGGLDRYYRDLLDHTPEARGVVVGRDASPPDRVAAVSRHDQRMPIRLVSVWRAAQRVAADVDVVDAHFALYALLPVRVGRLRRKPLVVHFHGPWADESVAAGDGSGLRRRARRMLERGVYGRADQAVVLTSAFRQVLVERYGVSPWIVSVEPPGVDLDRFKPGSRERARQELGVDPSTYLAITVRRLVPRMGLEVLLQAWRDSLASLPPSSLLMIVGAGALEPELDALATRYGIEGSLRLLGRVSDERLVALYQAADVAVVPTLEHEGFGLVVLEAAACGTPSIVTAVGGLPEAVRELDRSLIVPPGDPGALGARLVRSVEDRPGPAACRAYAERHRWSSVADRNRRIVRLALPTASEGGRPLKVVYLDHVARLSGGEIALLRLLPHLTGVSPHVILAEDGPLVGALHLAGCSTEVLAFDGSARDLHRGELRRGTVPAGVAAATAAYVLKLAARLRRVRPDLVHSNSLKAGVYGSLAARLAGIPMVWHVRDRIEDDYMPAAAVALIRAMTRRLPALVLANSQSTLDTLKPAGASAARYSVIADTLGDTVERGARVPAGRPATFAVVGRLAPWKGQDLFLRAFARAFPEGEQRGVVLGAALFGEDDYARQLPALVDRLGITSRIEFRGHRSDIWAELATVDVLVHTSLTPEPFGQVIVEGMAAGVPVIAAGAGGPSEIIEHDRTGLLYEPGSESALAHAMQRMQSPELRARLSALASEQLERYSAPVVATQLQSLYADVLALAARRDDRQATLPLPDSSVLGL